MANDLVKMSVAFGQLAGKGYEISPGYQDCSSCSVATFETNKFVYWHSQDEDRLDPDGNIYHGEVFMIGWGQDGDKHEIGETFESLGFKVEYPDSPATRIGISH